MDDRNRIPAESYCRIEARAINIHQLGPFSFLGELREVATRFSRWWKAGWVTRAEVHTYVTRSTTWPSHGVLNGPRFVRCENYHSDLSIHDGGNVLTRVFLISIDSHPISILSLSPFDTIKFNITTRHAVRQ